MKYIIFTLLVLISGCATNYRLGESEFAENIIDSWHAWDDGTQYTFHFNKDGTVKHSWYSGGCIVFEPEISNWDLVGDLLTIRDNSGYVITYRIIEHSSRSLKLHDQISGKKIKYKRI